MLYIAHFQETAQCAVHWHPNPIQYKYSTIHYISIQYSLYIIHTSSRVTIPNFKVHINAAEYNYYDIPGQGKNISIAQVVSGPV